MSDSRRISNETLNLMMKPGVERKFSDVALQINMKNLCQAQMLWLKSFLRSCYGKLKNQKCKLKLTTDAHETLLKICNILIHFQLLQFRTFHHGRSLSIFEFTELIMRSWESHSLQSVEKIFSTLLLLLSHIENK